MIEGTFAKMKCKNHYENVDIQYRNPLSQCKGGSWDEQIIRCVPGNFKHRYKSVVFKLFQCTEPLRLLKYFMEPFLIKNFFVVLVLTFSDRWWWLCFSSQLFE